MSKPAWAFKAQVAYDDPNILDAIKKHRQLLDEACKPAPKSPSLLSEPSVAKPKYMYTFYVYEPDAASGQMRCIACNLPLEAAQLFLRADDKRLLVRMAVELC
jgi:hypothetical protein